MDLSDLVASSYHVVAIVAYTIGIVLLARNFRNLATRLTALTLFSYSAWAVLFYAVQETAGFDEELIGFTLFVRSLFYPLLYLTIRSFRGVERYDYLSLCIPIVVLVYILLFEPIGTFQINPQVYYWDVIIPLFATFLILLNIMIYIGYRTYKEITDLSTKEKFFYLVFAFSLMGYIRAFEMFSYHTFGVAFTGLPHLIALGILIYPFLLKRKKERIR
ncbi:MAG: hypothetical protein QXT63_00445 [Thermoplasmata archaeon]